MAVNELLERPVALKLTNVKKVYRLGQFSSSTLKEELQRRREERKERKEGKVKKESESSRILPDNTFLALNDINLTIYEGEAVGIIGKNGAGKSTLLKLISRVTAPSAGEIEIYGRVTSMLEVGTGFHYEMTGKENIYLNGAILGMTKDEIDSKLEDIIDFSEVRDFIDTPVKRYSSGMYVKLGFSVAAHLESEIIIMDEVLAVGDMEFQTKCLDKMKEVVEKEGRTVLYVSHNMNTIKRLCSRCIVLDEGGIVFDGNVDEAINIYFGSDKTSKVFIDYREIERLPWLTDTKARFISAEIVGKNNTSFLRGDRMNLRFIWQNDKDIQNLSLRVEVLSTEKTAVGTAFLYDFYSGRKGETGEVEVELDLSYLASETYTLNYVLFEKNEYGINCNVDCVYGHKFTIEPDGIINWDTRYWGRVVLPDLKVRREEI